MKKKNPNLLTFFKIRHYLLSFNLVLVTPLVYDISASLVKEERLKICDKKVGENASCKLNRLKNG